MPDIMLLPVIADVFDTSVDFLFGRKSKSSKKNLCKQNLHEEMYDSFFETMQYFWNTMDGNFHEDIEERARENRDYLKTHPATQTMVLSDPLGTGVFADCDIALTLNKDKSQLFNLFDDDVAWTVLKRFSDGATRKVYKFIVENKNKSYTSSFVAVKCNIEQQEVERALENLLQMSLINRNDVDTDDGIIYVYRMWGNHKLILVYSMLIIASRLGNFLESYRGFMG